MKTAWMIGWQLLAISVTAQDYDWREVCTGGPSPRTMVDLTYDTARQICVLYGGYNGQGLNDTWEWNGQWLNRPTAHNPGPRYSYGLAYDQERGVTVLFGGNDGTTRTNSLWEYDGRDWLERSIAVRPPPVEALAFAYDPNRKLCVLYGGIKLDGTVSNQAWKYDGKTWTADTTWERRCHHAMVYSPGWQYMFRHGGLPLTPPFSTYLYLDHGGADEWFATGKWLDQDYYSIKLAYNQYGVVMFGGYWQDASQNAYLSNETWFNSGGTGPWSQSVLAHAPSPRADYAMTYDEVREETLLFGGTTAEGPNGETWELGRNQIPCDHLPILVNAVTEWTGYE